MTPNKKVMAVSQYYRERSIIESVLRPTLKDVFLFANRPNVETVLENKNGDFKITFKVKTTL
jgi:hypothetical protein